jgi:hypothetical protein
MELEFRGILYIGIEISITEQMINFVIQMFVKSIESGINKGLLCLEV